MTFNCFQDSSHLVVLELDPQQDRLNAWLSPQETTWSKAYSGNNDEIGFAFIFVSHCRKKVGYTPVQVSRFPSFMSFIVIYYHTQHKHPNNIHTHLSFYPHSYTLIKSHYSMGCGVMQTPNSALWQHTLDRLQLASGAKDKKLSSSKRY